MQCVQCKNLINQRIPTLLPLEELEARLNLRPNGGQVRRMVGEEGGQGFGTFWWLHKRSGSRKAYGSTEAGPMWDKSILIIADYQTGIGCKTIAKNRMGDVRRSTNIADLLRSVGLLDSSRRSPMHESKGPGQKSHSERGMVASFMADQIEWKRGIREYEKAVTPRDWRIAHNKMRLTPELEIKFNLRKRLRHCAIDKQHSLKSEELFGCTMLQLRTHLESQFLPWMNWENYGKAWHIDHRKPCKAFDLTDPEQAKACFHYTNLQPLEAKENIRKSDLLADGTRARHA